MEVWSWILEALGLIGAYFVGRKVWWAWLIMISASVLWIVFGWTTKQYGFSAASTVFLVVYSRNLRAWKADQSTVEPATQFVVAHGNHVVDVAKSINQ